MTLVMEGIHDEVYPWKNLIKEKEPEEEAAAGATDSAAAGVTDTGATIPAADEAGTEAAAVQYTEAEEAEVETVDTIPANAIHGDSNTIPEGVCNPVMQAQDYDVVNVAFLSPDDTEYNTDTEGIFAKNGIYFKLGPVDQTYFSDALFIGDSRTVGLCEYGGLKGNAEFLAKESINVYIDMQGLEQTDGYMILSVLSMLSNDVNSPIHVKEIITMKNTGSSWN